MEQEIIFDSKMPTEKIYKDKEVWVGTYLGGPLVAGYLIAENFKVFGEMNKARRTWIIAIISTVAIFSGAFFAPYIDRIPNFLFPLIYTGIAYVLVQMYQGENINAHIRAGGQIHSWWKTLGVALIGILITLIPVVGVAYLVDAAATVNETTKTYGTIKHEIVFDTSNISEAEVDAIAEGFRKGFFFDNEKQKFVYVRKVENNYEISISVLKSLSNDKEDLEWFVQLRNDMQTSYPNNKIIFNLVVDSLDNIIKRLE